MEVPKVNLGPVKQAGTVAFHKTRDALGSQEAAALKARAGTAANQGGVLANKLRVLHVPSYQLHKKAVANRRNSAL